MAERIPNLQRLKIKKYHRRVLRKGQKTRPKETFSFRLNLITFRQLGSFDVPDTSVQTTLGTSKIRIFRRILYLI